MANKSYLDEILNALKISTKTGVAASTAKSGALVSEALGTDTSKLRGIADGLSASVETDRQAGYNPQTRAEMAASMPTGSIFDGTLQAPKNPTLRGASLNLAESAVPTLASVGVGLATRPLAPVARLAAGAASNVVMASGAAANEEGQRARGRTIEQWAAIPAYLEARGAGKSHAEATEAVARSEERGAALATAVPAAVGGAATSAIVGKAGQRVMGGLLGESRAARAVSTGLVSGVEEGVQEVSEGVGQRLGAKLASGEERDIGEDSFANLVMGAAAGGGAGGIGAAVTANPVSPGPSATPPNTTTNRPDTPPAGVAPAAPEEVAATPLPQPSVIQPERGLISRAAAAGVRDGAVQDATIEFMGKPLIPVDPDERAALRFEERLTPLVEGLDPAIAQRLREGMAQPLTRDRVTGLHRSEELRETLDAAWQSGEPSVYVEADLANLGGLNAKLGNSAADPYIRRLTDIMQEELAPIGASVGIRKGGDEFGFVVRGAAKQGVDEAMLRARDRYATEVAAFAEVPHTKTGKAPGVGLHFGTAEIRPDVAISDTVREADTLVEARKQGMGYEFRQPTEALGIGQPVAAGAAAGAAAPGAGSAAAAGLPAAAPAQGVAPDDGLNSIAPGAPPAVDARGTPAAPAYPLAPAGTRYEETDAPITQMTPDEFLSSVRPLEIDEASRDNIDYLKQHMLDGGQLDPLNIRADGKEDGRHRAVAARELGMETVPVVDMRPGREPVPAAAAAPARVTTISRAAAAREPSAIAAASAQGAALRDVSLARTIGTPSEIDNASPGTATQGLPDDGSVRGGVGLLAQPRRPLARDARRDADGSLAGLPRDVGGFAASVHAPAAEVANAYMASRGARYAPPPDYAPVDKKRGKRIADAFTAMQHNPRDPEVARAYAAMIEETTAQYEAVLASGLQIEFITGDDPYAGNPREMTEDVRNNNHMYVFSTRDGFGSDATFDPSENPMLAETSFQISGQPALANDLFRVVHDYFGHVKEGVGFRAAGEENAWRAHSAMFSPLARRAMTTETRGQNSWVNFGPFRKHNLTATGATTRYADQKIGLLPEWAMYDGSGFNDNDGMNRVDVDDKNATPADILGKRRAFLTSDEFNKLRRDTAIKFVALLEKMPSAKEMANVALAGKAKRGWYKDSATALLDVFGFDAPRFSALLAALSPQTSVEANLYNALHTWKNWVAAGRPKDRDTIVEIMGRSVQGKGTIDSVLGAWINNSVRALTAEDANDVTLSGPKVNSFMLNLRGVVNEVTNDAWMANYALVDQTIFSGGLTKSGDPGKGPGYLAMSARVREAAKVLKKMTGQEWSPAEVQETVWSWAKTIYELANSKGEIRSAVELVRDNAITDEMIAATPAFGELFHVEQYRTILEAAGLRAPAQRPDGRQADAVAGAGTQAAAPARRDLERAAGRLDALRKQRQGVDRVDQFAAPYSVRTSRNYGVMDGDEVESTQKAIARLKRQGYPQSWIDRVSSFFVHNNTETFAARFYMYADKKGSISVRANRFGNPENLVRDLAHEMGHAADYDMDAEGFYSSQSPLFATSGTPGSMVYTGEVVAELHAAWKQVTPLARELAYPFDPAQGYDAETIKVEAFAQSVMLYFTERDNLKTYAPKTHKLIREIIENEKAGSNARGAAGSAGGNVALQGALRSPGVGPFVRGADSAGVRESSRPVDRAQQAGAGAARGSDGPVGRVGEYSTLEQNYAAYRKAYESPEYAAIENAWRAAQAKLAGLHEIAVSKQLDALQANAAGISGLDKLPRDSWRTMLNWEAINADPAIAEATQAANMARSEMEGYSSEFVKANYPPLSPFVEDANPERSYYDSPNFRRWFADSKVVDSNGRPLVAMHGSPNAFVEFSMANVSSRRGNPEYTGQLGMWFAAPDSQGYGDPGTTPSTAGTFAGEKDGAVIYPVHLSIKNPMEFDGFDDLRDYREQFTSVPKMRAKLIADGYDGVVVRQSDTDGGDVRDDWVAFYPNQIKSAIGNSGAFDPNNKSILGSRTARGNTFFSAMSRSVAAAKGAPKKAPALLWKQWLDGAQRRGEFKKEERDWIGVDAWLEEAGTVTHQQLVDFVKANEVQVTDVILRERTGMDDLSPSQIDYIYDTVRERLARWGNLDAEAESWLDRFAQSGDTDDLSTVMSDDDLGSIVLDSVDEEDGNANHAEWQLPGGHKEYHELLLTMPGIDYTTESHFGDRKGIIAHVRFNSRVDDEGRSVLLIEEVQSDFGQATRKSKLQIVQAVKADFDGIVDRMKADGVLAVECD